MVTAVSRKRFNVTLLMFLLPILLGFLVLSFTWLELAFIPGTTIQPELSVSGYHSPIYLALLLASGAVLILFRLASKHLKYILALLNMVFGFLIVLTLVKFFDQPEVTVQQDLAELTGLNGKDIFDTVVSSYEITVAPWFMFLVAFMMLIPTIFTFLYNNEFPVPNKKYDRNETSANHWVEQGAEDEDSID